MATIDIVTILIYLAAVFGLGAAFTRRAHSDTNSYFLSSRGLPWWIAGTSMVATSFSCDTPLYVTRLIRSGGIWLNWQWWSFAIGGLFSAFLLARLWRRAQVVTDVELTELRYGAGPGRVLRFVRAGWTALLINTISMSWVLLAMAKITGAVWGGPKWAGVLTASALAITYSFMAGFWGVVVTDVAQFLVALIGAIALAFFSVKAAGGMETIIATAGPERLSMVPAFPEGGLFSAELWTGAFGGFLIYASLQWWANINSDGGGKVIQRMSAARDERHAFGATLWFNVAHYALRTWPWIIAALASLVIFPNIADDELAYPQLIMTVLPSPWIGILLAGLLAAFMSTIDTQLNWGASYLTHDLYRSWIAPNRSEKHYLWAAKGSMLLLIAITSVTAYFITSVTEAFKFIIAFGAGLGPVLILRWFWWRLNAWSEIAAMAASTVISTIIYLAFPGMAFALRVVTIATGSAIIWLPITFLTKPAATATLVDFWSRTRTPGAWGPVRNVLMKDAESSDTPHTVFGKPDGEEVTKSVSSIKSDLLGWAGGVALTLGLTFSIGWLILGNTLPGLISLAISLIGGWITLRWMRKTF